MFEIYKRDNHSAAVHLQGGLLTVKNVSLPKATFVKFQPQHVDFLQISNPRAVLERQLRHFSCVTVGDQICIPYNDRRYYLEVREVKPQEAACIIECDCNVDFDAPVGYVDPSVVRLAARPRVAPRLCACARTRVLCRPVLIEICKQEHHAAQARAAAAAAEASAAPAISMPAPQLAKKAEVTEETSFAVREARNLRWRTWFAAPSSVRNCGTSHHDPNALVAGVYGWWCSARWQGAQTEPSARSCLGEQTFRRSSRSSFV